MGKIIKWIFWSLIIVTVVFGCTTRAKYDQMVENGLESGERYDSLFLGISFGMTSSEFFDHCFELNRQHLVYEGGENTTVRYKLKELDHPAEMNFYPAFHETEIWQMSALIDYDAWAPWNRHLFSDSLQTEVVNLMIDWYGDGWIEVQHPKKGSAFVKVDGNRQISVYIRDDRFVEVMYTDLVIKQEISESDTEQPGG